MSNPVSVGCVCQGCGKTYVTDLLVPDEIWARIRPTGELDGLLCPTCIMDRAADRCGWTVGFVYPKPAPEFNATHDSDCSLHSGPAYTPGPCDCLASTPAKPVGELVGIEPVGWFIDADNFGVYQQVAKQHEGEPDLVPLYGPEAASQLAAVTAALDRQCDNMAFILNRVDLHAWHDKFSRELTEDRAALNPKAPS